MSLLALTAEEIEALESVGGESPFDWTTLTQDQIRFIKALAAYIRTHPGV